MKIKEYPSVILRSVSLLLQWLRAGDLACGELPVVVSLTSIPSRLSTVHLTILSIIFGSIRPRRIYLWLNESLRGKIPGFLDSMQGDLFEIRYCAGTSSHRKLLMPLSQLESQTIVVCDDDVMYPVDWLQSLYESSLRRPGAVIGHVCRRIAYDDAGNLLPYQAWRHSPPGESDVRLLPIGVGGVLYPPNCLFEDFDNEALYQKLAPRADDLWFKAMTLLKGTPVCSSLNPPGRFLPTPYFKKESLSDLNVKFDMNSVQWKSICQYYNIRF